MTTRKKPSQPPVSFLVMQREIPAAVFKARCLEIMDEVERTGESVTITKHRKPVVQLIPIPVQRKSSFFGSMAGRIRILGDIISPVSEEGDGDASNLT